MVKELDKVKTYSKFLLERYNPNIKRIKQEWDTNYKYTGRLVLSYSEGKEVFAGDRELIKLVRETMSQQKECGDLSKYLKNKGFREFVERHLSGIVEISKLKENGGIEHD